MSYPRQPRNVIVYYTEGSGLNFETWNVNKYMYTADVNKQQIRKVLHSEHKIASHSILICYENIWINFLVKNDNHL